MFFSLQFKGLVLFLSVRPSISRPPDGRPSPSAAHMTGISQSEIAFGEEPQLLNGLIPQQFTQQLLTNSCFQPKLSDTPSVELFVSWTDAILVFSANREQAQFWFSGLKSWFRSWPQVRFLRPCSVSASLSENLVRARSF